MIFSLAQFEGCPMQGKKIGSPQGETTHADVSDWGDCSLKCEAETTCGYWHWNSGTKACSLMTGDGVYADDAAFVAGKRGCHINSNVTGWITCVETEPWSNLPGSKYAQVRIFIAISLPFVLSSPVSCLVILYIV